MFLGQENSSGNVHKEKSDKFGFCWTCNYQQQHSLNTYFSLPLRGPTALTVFWERCRSRMSSCSMSSLSHWRQPKAEQMYLTWKDRYKFCKEYKLQEIRDNKRIYNLLKKLRRSVRNTQVLRSISLTTNSWNELLRTIKETINIYFREWF